MMIGIYLWDKNVANEVLRISIYIYNYYNNSCTRTSSRSRSLQVLRLLVHISITLSGFFLVGLGPLQRIRPYYLRKKTLSDANCYSSCTWALSLLSPKHFSLPVALYQLDYYLSKNKEASSHILSQEQVLT